MSMDLDQFGKDLRAYLKTVPREIGKAVLLETSDNFRRQGYETEEGGIVSWDARKAGDKVKGRKRKDGSRARSKPNPRQRAILVKSGRLRRSIRIVATTDTSVTVGSSEAYAEALQDGNSKLPARPFITLGRSGQAKLAKQIGANIMALLK